jgi:hypothetical protein
VSKHLSLTLADTSGPPENPTNRTVAEIHETASRARARGLPGLVKPADETTGSSNGTHSRTRVRHAFSSLAGRVRPRNTADNLVHACGATSQ